MVHPARVAIFNLLAKRQACVCGDIVEELPRSQSTMLQHLKELKEAVLITGEIEGAKVCYLFEDRDKKSLPRIMEQADADIMCFDHTINYIEERSPLKPLKPLIVMQ